MNNKREFMNIPYEVKDNKFNQWFTCKYFNFYPYHIMSFSTNTEDEMKQKIADYVDNRVKYERKYKLSTKAAAQFYKELNYKGD
jgi:hypothetical protein|tara:strand:- start:402 stop:653 length:252 start_codon:yes stop_codon:yes gene_type:complete